MRGVVSGCWLSWLMVKRGCSQRMCHLLLGYFSLLFLIVWDWVSLCSPDQPGTHCVAKTGLRPLGSSCHVLALLLVTGGKSHSAWLHFSPVFSRVLVLKGNPGLCRQLFCCCVPSPWDPAPSVRPIRKVLSMSGNLSWITRTHIPHECWGTCTSCAHTQLVCNKLIHKTFKGCF